MNDLLKRSLAPAKIPSLLEPTGIARSNGRRLDGISVMPWRNGLTLVWDATCPVHSPIPTAAKEAGLMANQAEKAKSRSTPFSVLATIETSGVFKPEGIAFIEELGRRIRAETGETRSLQGWMSSGATRLQ